MMTPAEMDKLAKELPYVKAWVQAAEAELLRLLEAGEVLNNVALEPTRPMRKWEPGLDVVGFLSQFGSLDAVAPRKALSPPEAEKALGKKVYQDQIAKSVVKVSSGMRLTFSKEIELED